MTTLLSQRSKKQLKKDYLVRFFVVLLSLSIVVVSVWSVLTWALFFVLDSEEQTLRKQIDKSSQREVTALLSDYQNALKEVDSKLVLFEPVGVSRGEIINFIYTVKPLNISFTNLTINNINNKTIVDISGTSDSRETLIFFKNLLESNENVSDFDLPLSSFTRNEQIPFSISFSYGSK